MTNTLILAIALACNLGALTPAERTTHDALTHKLLSAVVSRSETIDGYAFRLDRRRITTAELGQWIELEARCCPFFDFAVNAARDNGTLTLTLCGDLGVKEFIQSEFSPSPQHR